MDHAGAVIGPLLAFGLLSANADLGHVFLASSGPGLLVLLLLMFGLPAGEPLVAPPHVRFSWSRLHGRLRAMIVAAGWLALASVPEVFVVLWATQAGMAIKWVPLVWAAASLAKMLIAMPAGILSDRLGRTPVLLGGWGARVAILLLLAFMHAPSAYIVWVLFIAYSMTLAITEPAERSLIGDHAGGEQRGTAYGLYHLASGLLVLPGAVIFGSLWEAFGSSTAFAAAAVITAGAAVWMLQLSWTAPSLRTLPVPRCELLHDAVEREIARLQQHQQVIQEVGTLADQLRVLARNRGQRCFDTFLADLLCDTPETRRDTAARCNCLPGSPRFAVRSLPRATRGRRAGLKRSPSASAKQDTVPLWQVGPTGFASTRIVSLSQSVLTCTTSR